MPIPSPPPSRCCKEFTNATGLAPSTLRELAVIAYRLAEESSTGEEDLVAEMFFRGFALARFVGIQEEPHEAEVRCLN